MVKMPIMVRIRRYHNVDVSMNCFFGQYFIDKVTKENYNRDTNEMAVTPKKGRTY